MNLWPSLGLEMHWSTLFTSSKKSEHFTLPAANLTAMGAGYLSADHGFTGPLATCFSTHLANGNGSLHAIFNDTFKAVGIAPRHEFNGGDLLGFGVQQVTQNASADVREDAARAYYFPVQSRPNLSVFVNMTATRLVWSSKAGPNGKLIASGAEAVDQTGKVYTISADREVVLSAGAIRSPVILENSGVGNPSVLSKQSVPVKMALRGVGENLQDQTTIAITASTSSTLGYNFTGLPGFVAHASLHDLFGTATASFYNNTLAKLPTYAKTISGQNGGASNASVQEQLLKSQLDLLFKSNTPATEIAPLGILNFIGAIFWPLQPFSRGSVHINSTNLTAHPVIDAKFFQFDFDGDMAVASARWSQKLILTEPFASIVNISTLNPSLATVPENATDAVWLEWIKTKSAYAPNYHHLGTCAMLPRGMGGVVDNEFRVYGIGNVRVIDLSVVPLQVAGHSTALLYGVAEWAVGKIKAEWS
jgi:choline dehydrogenase-like flavoprotein